MTVIKRRIYPPNIETEDQANATIKQYMQDIELLLLDAGLIKSATTDNIDVLDPPPFPWAGVNSVWMTKALSYDLNDTYQAELPIRISFTFGFYRHQSTDYPRRIILHTAVGVIDPVTNKMIPDKAKYAVNYIYGHGDHSGNGPLTYLDYGMSSFVNVKDGFVCICISPGVGSYAPQSTGGLRNTNIFIVIERNFDDAYMYNGTGCNIIMRDTASAISTSTTLNTTAISATEPSIVTSTNMLFANTSGFLANGKLITYPVMHINNGAHLLQTPNMVITNSRAIGSSQPIDLVINGVTKRFESIFAGGGTYPISSSATLLVTGE